MNAQDMITQQDNEQTQMLIEAFTRAQSDLTTASEALLYATDGTVRQTFDAAQLNYQTAMRDLAQHMAALWRAGYQLTR